MRRLLLLAALCVFVAAMVPRERRAMNTDEDLRPSTSRPICARSQPCGWVFYKHQDIVESEPVNPDCQCDASTTCQVHEDDNDSQSLIKRCKPKNLANMES